MSSRLEYLPAGCLGKLPFDREHLDMNTGYASAVVLETWITEGRQAAMLGTGEEDRPTIESAHLRFLANEGGGPEVLAGILRPSQDLERRTFPFVLFAPVPRSLYGRHNALLPLGLQPVWDGIDDLWTVLSTSVTRAAFLEVLSGAAVPAPLPVADARELYEAGQAESSARIFARTNNPGRTALEGEWSAALDRLRRLTSRGRTGPRLALPLSEALDRTGFDLAFWIDMLNRQFLLRRFEPTVFLDAAADAAAREALLLFGPLAPDDYAGVTAGRPSRTAEVAAPSDATGETRTNQAGLAYPSFAELLSRRTPFAAPQFDARCS